jgi:multiple sugar transport system permease protein
MPSSSQARRRGPVVRPVGSANHQARLATLFLLPALLLVLLVTLIPIVYALSLSVLNTDYLDVVGFAGLGHYARFLSEGLGRRNIVASITFTLGSLALAVPLGLGLALLLNREFRLRTFFRTLLILPMVITVVASAMLWNWLYNAQYGPINYLLNRFFGVTINFLAQPEWAMPSMVLVNVWQSYPYAMILLLAGLQTIPIDLLEAASIDGASRWRQFISVKLPLLQRHILVVMILLGINYLNQATLPLILTGGGPLNSTYVMSIRVYNEAFSFYHMGFASAVGVVMLVFNLLFTLLYLWVLRQESTR